MIYFLIDGTSGKSKNENDDVCIDIEEIILHRFDLKDYNSIVLDEFIYDFKQKNDKRETFQLEWKSK